MGSIMVFAIPLGFSDIVNVVTKEVDKLMIGGFLDTESLAIYTNAAREIALTVISTSFIAVVMPKVSKMVKEKRMDEAIEVWKKTTSFTYIFMCFGVAALVVFAPWVITILYSEKYLPGENVFRIYALILLWRTTYFGMMLSQTGETTKILICSFLTMVLNVVGNIGLYQLMGFSGPAWSTFISIGVVNILQLIITSVILKYPFTKIFPWLDTLKITAINLVMGIAVYFLLKWLALGTDITGCIIAVGIGIVWMGIYFLIMRKRIVRQWKED
jgi:O-antigen/teichoic acid export membrane protein